MNSEQQTLSEIRNKDIDELDAELQSSANQFYPKTPNEWGFAKLDNIIEKFIDYRGKTPPKADEGIHMLSAANIKDGFILPERKEKFVSEDTYDEWTTRGIPSENDVVVTTEAPVGEVGMIRTNDRFLTAQRLITLRAGEALDPNYLKFCLQYRNTQKQLESYSSGTTVSSFNQTDLRNTVIPLPSLKEQKNIGKILGDLEKKIENNQDINEILEKISRSLFRSEFINYDSYDKLKNTECGKIPESFEVGTLAELIEKKTNGVDEEDMSSSTPYISLKHMPEESVILNKWDDAGDISSRKYQFQRGDILFGKLRPYFCKVGPAQIDGVCSTDIIVITPKKDDIWREYIIFQLSNGSFIDYCDKVSTGTRMPRVSWKDICEYQLPIPTREAVKNFHENVEPILDLIASNIHESNDLKEIRDSLIPRLLSGEVRVNDINLEDVEVGSEV